NNIEKIYKTNNYKINNNLYLNKEKVFDWPSLGLNNNDSRGFCYGLKSHIAILSDGTVVPCCLDSNGIIDLGNIFEENLEKILEKERTKKIINGFKSRTIVEELCKKCTYKNRFNK
ncbi:MAG TPA: radical SAM protein, partial [Tenericutes bacterium]|nr:radical SAM protein [Mycoplasmatota bacterium]